MQTDPASHPDTVSPRRPACLTVVGWIWIVSGSFEIVLGIAILLLFRVFGFFFNEIYGPFPNLSPFVKLIWVIPLLSICWGGASLVTGIQLLRLKAWARTAIEVLTWLGVIFNVGAIILQLTQFTADGLLSSLISAMIVVLCGTILKCLRSEAVRNAVRLAGSRSQRNRSLLS